MEKDPYPGQMVFTPDPVARTTRQIALDMAMRYFPAKTAKQLVENAAVFESYITGENNNG